MELQLLNSSDMPLHITNLFGVAMLHFDAAVQKMAESNCSLSELRAHLKQSANSLTLLTNQLESEVKSMGKEMEDIIKDISDKKKAIQNTQEEITSLGLKKKNLEKDMKQAEEQMKFYQDLAEEASSKAAEKENDRETASSVQAGAGLGGSAGALVVLPIFWPVALIAGAVTGVTAIGLQIAKSELKESQERFESQRDGYKADYKKAHDNKLKIESEIDDLEIKLKILKFACHQNEIRLDRMKQNHTEKQSILYLLKSCTTHMGKVSERAVILADQSLGRSRTVRDLVPLVREVMRVLSDVTMPGNGRMLQWGGRLEGLENTGTSDVDDW